MTLRKLPDPETPNWSYAQPAHCTSSEHYGPTMMVLEPGMWEYTCPRCGEKTQFRVPPKPTCVATV